MLLMWGFGSEMPVVTLSLLLPLSSACVTHTNGNNFFQFLLAEVGGPVTCAARGLLSSSPSLFCSGCRGQFILTLTPLQRFSSLASLCGCGSCLLNSCASMSPHLLPWIICCSLDT